MNAELETLGRRAVACKHWRYRIGMVLTDGAVVVRVAGNGHPVVAGGVSRGGNALSEVYPDLSDAATVGAVLGLVAGAYPGCAMQLARYSDGSADLDIFDTRGANKFTSYERDGSTLGAILVCALEAAP